MIVRSGARVGVGALAVLALTVGLGGGANPIRHGSAVPAAETAASFPHSEMEHPPGESSVIQHAGAPGTDPTAAYRDALLSAGRASARTATAAPALAGTGWGFIGPVNIGGRVTAVAVDPTLAGRIFIATASGGVWRSTDGGATFSAAWPLEQTQAIGGLDIDSDGILYAGTGEANPGGGSITYGGTGIYRSRDHGASWQPVGLAASSSVSRIMVDRATPHRVYAAVTGNLYIPGGERGLYVSNDSGDTWNLLLAGANPTTGASDIAIDPTHPATIYATMWDHVRHPNLRVYGGPGSGLFKSTNSGVSWTKLTVSSQPAAKIGRMDVAVAPSSPNIVYSLVSSTDGPPDGFYTSTNGGGTFSKLTEPISGAVLSTALSSYAWWFGQITVDPALPSHVWVMGVLLLATTDAGVHFAPSGISTFPPDAGLVHADQHALVYDPANPLTIYLATDGGLYHSSTAGASFAHSTFEPFTQFNSVDVSQQDESRVVGGAQDNGALRSYGGSNWNSYGGGDGQKTLINPTNQNNVFACSQYGACTYSSDGGQNNSSIGSTTSSRQGWLTPMEFDPQNPSIVYWAGNQVNRSVDGGHTFSVISPDLTGGPPPDPIYKNYGTVTTLAALPMARGYIIAGTDDGRIWFTKDSGAHWTRSLDPHLPGSWVTRVVIDPAYDGTVYSTFSGFRSGNAAAYVLRSRDWGVTWSDISGDLPRAPVNKLLVIDGAPVVAGDVGVYASTDGGLSWLRVGAGLPQAPITDLRWRASDRKLFAASFGRGMWQVTVPSLTVPAVVAAVGPGLPNTAAAAPSAPWAPVAIMVSLAAVVSARRLFVGRRKQPAARHR